MNPVSRRDLLILGAQSFGALSLSGCDFFSRSKLVPAPQKNTYSATAIIPTSKMQDGQNVVHYFKMGDSQARTLLIPLKNAHSAIRHPTDPNLAIVTECSGPKACVVNLQSGSVVETFSAEDGCVFGGHFNFRHGRDLLYTTEYDPKGSKKSFFTIRDVLANYKVIEKKETKGHVPHGIFPLDAQGLLAVQHFGKPGCGETYAYRSNFTYFDIETLRYLESKPLKAMDEKDFSKAMPAETKLDSQAKILVINEIAFKTLIRSKILRVMVPLEKEKLLVHWDTRIGRVLNTISVAPLTPIDVVISPDRKYFVVATREGSIVYVNVRSGRIYDGLSPTQVTACTSHLSFV
jgi:hypothetical protein